MDVDEVAEQPHRGNGVPEMTIKAEQIHGGNGVPEMTVIKKTLAKE